MQAQAAGDDRVHFVSNPMMALQADDSPAAGTRLRRYVCLEHTAVRGTLLEASGSTAVLGRTAGWRRDVAPGSVVEGLETVALDDGALHGRLGQDEWITIRRTGNERRELFKLYDPAEPIMVPIVAVVSEPDAVAQEAAAVGAAAAPSMRRVDTSALTGLRGCAALHVALGHVCIFSEIGVDLLGGAAMPFFYLLSGFVMTLGCKIEMLARFICRAVHLANPESITIADGGEGEVNRAKFLQNRAARLLSQGERGQHGGLHLAGAR